jgi:CheY-like chemotaxis protein
MKTNKILIVDDDIDVINIIGTILRHEGYEIECANNKNDGIKKAREWQPHLVILDVMMSTHYEGFEMAREMNQDPMLKNTPVIIQTSIDVFETSLQSVAQMALEYRGDPRYKELQVVLLKDKMSGQAGIDYRTENGGSVWVPVGGFIKKPVDSSRLLPEINRLLKKK